MSDKRDSRTQEKRSRRSAARLGPLYIDPKYLEPGFVYKFISATIPGVLEYYVRLGYEVVKKDLKAGDADVATSSSHGGSVTVQSKCGQELVLMKIPEDIHAEIDQELLEEQRSMMEALQRPDGIDEKNLTGKITIK